MTSSERADHTGAVGFPDQIVYAPIGVVRSPYKERFGTPQQARTTGGDPRREATIEIFPRALPPEALRDLDGFDRIWVLAHLHLNQGFNAMVKPPRGPRVKRGLLATRAPHRPNPIGLSATELVRVEGCTIHVLGLDLLDGTPVLDVKPYVAYADAFPDASAGWVDEIDEAETQTGRGPRPKHRR